MGEPPIDASVADAADPDAVADAADPADAAVPDAAAPDDAAVPDASARRGVADAGDPDATPCDGSHRRRLQRLHAALTTD